MSGSSAKTINATISPVSRGDKIVSLCSTGRNLDESGGSQANFPLFNVVSSSLITIGELGMAKMEKVQPKLDLLGMTLIKSG